MSGHKSLVTSLRARIAELEEALRESKFDAKRRASFYRGHVAFITACEVTEKQAAQARESDLFFRGDMTLIWVCEGDLQLAMFRSAMEQVCACGDRKKVDCPGEWEPGCDLGANEAHAVPSKSEPPRKHALGALEETMSAESIARSDSILQSMREEIDAAGKEPGDE